MQTPPKVLNDVVDVVLAYRPKPKSAKGKARARKSKKKKGDYIHGYIRVE